MNFAPEKTPKKKTNKKHPKKDTTKKIRVKKGDTPPPIFAFKSEFLT